MLHEMIYSLMKSYYHQNTLHSDYKATIIRLYQHLLARGWKKDTLKKYILDTKLHTVPLAGHQDGNTPTGDPTNKLSTRNRLFFHLPYHPNDIPRPRIQQLYQQHCQKAFTSISINSLTVAFSRHKNLREHLTQA